MTMPDKNKIMPNIIGIPNGKMHIMKTTKTVNEKYWGVWHTCARGVFMSNGVRGMECEGWRNVHAPALHVVEYRLRRIGVGAGAPHFVSQNEQHY